MKVLNLGFNHITDTCLVHLKGKSKTMFLFKYYIYLFKVLDVYIDNGGTRVASVPLSKPHAWLGFAHFGYAVVLEDIFL